MNLNAEKQQQSCQRLYSVRKYYGLAEKKLFNFGLLKYTHLVRNWFKMKVKGKGLT